MSLEERVFRAEALNRAFFRLMLDGQSIDLITLADRLHADGTLELVGGLATISKAVVEGGKACH